MSRQFRWLGEQANDVVCAWNWGRTLGLIAIAGVVCSATVPGIAQEADDEVEETVVEPPPGDQDDESLVVEQEQSDEQPQDKPATVSSADSSAALESEESLGRFQQLLQRRPLHVPAFNGLVGYY